MIYNLFTHLNKARLQRWQSLVIVIVFSAISTNLIAADELDIDKAKKELDSINVQYSYASSTAKNNLLQESLVKVTALHANIKTCTTEEQQNYARLAPNGSEELVTKQKDQTISPDEERLLIEIQSTEKRLNECLLLEQKTDELITRINKAKQEIFRDRYSERTPNGFRLIQQNIGNLWNIGKSILASFFSEKEISRLDKSSWILIFAIVILVFASAFRWRSKIIYPAHIDEPLSTSNADQAFTRKLAKTFKRSFQYYLPLLAALGIGSLLTGRYFADYSEVPLIESVFFVATIAIISLILIRSTLLPKAPLQQITQLSNPVAHSLGRRFIIFTFLMATVYIFFGTPILSSLSDSERQFIHLILSTILIGNLFRMWLLVGKARSQRVMNRGLRFVVLMILLACLVSEWLGFQNFSVFLRIGLIGSTLATVFYLGLTRIIREICEGLDVGATPWQQSFRKSLDLTEDQPVPGLFWFRLLSGIFLTAILILVVLKSWGLYESGFVLILKLLVEGIPIGNSSIVPTNLILGILVFFLVLALSRWFRDNLDKRWLDARRLDIGAREAIITITGYVGFIIASLFGLSTAGVDFQNVAIIAWGPISGYWFWPAKYSE